MVAGRPRTVSPPPEEMIKLGQEMVAWVKANNPFHISEWYSIEKMIINQTWRTYIKREEFIPYYERALKMVSRNYLNGNVAPPIAQRFLRIYFSDVKEDENEKMIFEASLKQPEQKENATTPEQLANVNKALDV